MGASGSGKTTLLNILATNIPISEDAAEFASGKVFANEVQVSSDNFGNFANYVMQHDILL